MEKSQATGLLYSKCTTYKCIGCSCKSEEQRPCNDYLVVLGTRTLSRQTITLIPYTGCKSELGSRIGTPTSDVWANWFRAFDLRIGYLSINKPYLSLLTII